MNTISNSDRDLIGKVREDMMKARRAYKLAEFNRNDFLTQLSDKYTPEQLAKAFGMTLENVHKVLG